MSAAQDILRALISGPMTNAALCEATGRNGKFISCACNFLIRNGQVERVDGQKPGRGYPATYALTGRPPPEKSLTKLRVENAALREALGDIERRSPHPTSRSEMDEIAVAVELTFEDLRKIRQALSLGNMGGPP